MNARKYEWNDGLTLAHFHTVNAARCGAYHPGTDDEPGGVFAFTTACWCSAMCGEVGEVLNTRHKIWAGDRVASRDAAKPKATWADLRAEVVDVITYADLALESMGVGGGDPETTVNDLARDAWAKMEVAQVDEILPALNLAGAMAFVGASMDDRRECEEALRSVVGMGLAILHKLGEADGCSVARAISDKCHEITARMFDRGMITPDQVPAFILV